MNARRLIGLFVMSIAAGSCGSSAMPAAPSTPVPATPAPAATAIDVSGNWSGGATDSQGPTTVAWTLTQSGSTVAGTVRTAALHPDDGSCGSCHRNKSGTVTGTVSSASLMLTMSFAAGVDGDPTPECSATISVSSVSVSGAAVAATYLGSDTCEGAFNNGTLAMHR
jgi:hypothetical protein